MSATEERARQYRDDPRSSTELLCLVATKDVDADNDGYWHPIWILQHRLPEIIEDVRGQITSSDAKSREIAATILGQNGVKEKANPTECVDLLLGMIRQESDPIVLSSIIHALGHLHDVRSIQAVLPFLGHENAEVRQAIVHGLSSFDDQSAINGLIKLSADQDREVRNWATFGLGSMIDTDLPEIRDALFARLNETEDEIRGEALVGLAQRGDPRVITPLLHELEACQPAVLRSWDLLATAAEFAVRAATKTGDKAWLPVLEKLQATGIGDAQTLQAALDRIAKGQT